MTVTSVSPHGRFRSPLAEHLNSLARNYSGFRLDRVGESATCLKRGLIELRLGMSRSRTGGPARTRGSALH